jgi:hypothetical protein
MGRSISRCVHECFGGEAIFCSDSAMGQMSSQQAAAWRVGQLQAAQRMQQAKDAMCVQMNR